MLPALKATGRDLQSHLREAAGAGLRLGRTWNVLIAVQVAVAVSILPVAALMAWETRPRLADPGFPADRMLIAEVDADAPAAQDEVARDAQRAQRGAILNELMRRLKEEPAIAAVAFSSRLPGIGPRGQVDVEGGGPAPNEPDVLYLQVGHTFLEAYDAAVVAGRDFGPADSEGGARLVVVNESFARTFVDDGNALGRRIRYTRHQSNLPLVDSAGTWYEIVGVVRDFPVQPPAGLGDLTATVYHPVSAGTLERPRLALRVQRAVDAGSVTRLARVVATAVDPALQLRDIRWLDAIYADERRSVALIGWTFTLATLSVLLLSGAGIYALMAFTVAQRTREIGIRSALGATPARVFARVFGRALTQVGVGAALGLLLGIGLIASSGIETGSAIALTAVTAIIIACSALTAAAGPAMRALRIQPTDALRSE